MGTWEAGSHKIIPPQPIKYAFSAIMVNVDISEAVFGLVRSFIWNCQRLHVDWSASCILAWSGVVPKVVITLENVYPHNLNMRPLKPMLKSLSWSPLSDRVSCFER